MIYPLLEKKGSISYLAFFLVFVLFGGRGGGSRVVNFSNSQLNTQKILPRDATGLWYDLDNLTLLHFDLNQW